MLKKLVLICISYHFLAQAYAQDSIQFTMYMKPMHEYRIVSSLDMETKTTFSGDDSVLEKMEKKGIKNPYIIPMKTSTEIINSTGLLNGEHRFPIKMVLLNMTKDKNGKPAPTIKFYGSATTETLPILDSIEVANMNTSIKAEMLKTYNNIYRQFELPDKKMLVGESYTKTSPVHLSLTGREMNMIATTVYTLVSVVDKIANFNITITYVMNMDITKKETVSFSGFGEAHGKMQYDITQSYPLGYELNTLYKMNSEAEKKNLKMEFILSGVHKLTYHIKSL